MQFLPALPLHAVDLHTEQGAAVAHTSVPTPRWTFPSCVAVQEFLRVVWSAGSRCESTYLKTTTRIVDRGQVPSGLAATPTPSSAFAFDAVFSCNCRSWATSNASMMTARNKDRSVNFPMRTQITKKRHALLWPLLRIVLYMISSQFSKVRSCTQVPLVHTSELHCKQLPSFNKLNTVCYKDAMVRNA